ncbi:Lysine histidine transporter 1, partial [Mucuna pruriens]
EHANGHGKGYANGHANGSEAAETRLASEQQKLEDWLPVSASRKAKWWYSTFHNVTAMVGAGVLGLPYALSQLGWYGSGCYNDRIFMDSDLLFAVATS